MHVQAPRYQSSTYLLLQRSQKVLTRCNTRTMNELIKNLRRPHTELVNIIDSSIRNHSLLTLDASTRERELALSEARRHAAQSIKKP
jgi:hypothetical protein